MFIFVICTILACVPSQMGVIQKKFPMYQLFRRVQLAGAGLQ